VAAVQKCLSLYAGISMVHFFGGEPLLNPGAIRATCDYLKSALGPACPSFVATTNGTILTAELESLLVENQIGLTISVDGPASIHDRLRPTREQSSSHGVLCKNVERLRELGVTVDFECTYTLAHHHAGISVSDLLDYFSEELDEPHPHIAWSYLPRPLARTAGDKFGIFRNDFESQVRQHLPVELLTGLFRDAARKSMENIASGRGAALSFVTRILEHLTTRRPADSYCPAFTSQLSIATDGTAYPCFMFIGDPRMKLGNIFRDTFPTQSAVEVWRKYQEGFGETGPGSQKW
jgi:sulfatase maturation enzyme AslB (radical SAM superfamily)